MNITGLKLLICLAAFAVGAEEPNQTSAAAGLQESAEKAGLLQKQIRMLRISAMDPNITMQSYSLKSLIDQIQGLELPPEALSTASPLPVQDTVLRPPVPAAAKKMEAKAVPLTEIDAVTEPLNPLAAADALYRMGDCVRAMRFYDKIVEQKSDLNVSSRQWAMYQAANCMRCLDTNKAMERYDALLAEYPNNTWAAAALAQKQALEWLKKNETEIKQRMAVNDPNQR